MMKIYCVYCNSYHCIIMYRLITVAFPLTDKAQYNSTATAVCTTTDCTLSAFKLINALCVGSEENVSTLQELLTQLFYSGTCPSYSMALHMIM